MTEAVGSYLRNKAYGSTLVDDLQVIPARHGTATFVPAGSSIKIINSAGTQVIDTWAFALPQPPSQNPKEEAKQEEKQAEDEAKNETPQKSTPAKATPKKKGKGGMDLPSQEEAEAATKSGVPETEEQKNKKSGWSSYIPSVPFSGGGGGGGESKQGAAEKKKQNSNTWSSYLGGAGQAVSSGGSMMGEAKNALSSFTKQHSRNKNKPYLEQLYDFSRTPVGAAGLSAISGSGYTSSIYAGYSAFTGNQQPPPPMEYLSMPHTRAATGHIVPRVDDVLVSNLREPMLTLLEDTSPGVHDTLIAACDPQRYKGLGVEDWQEHGSCAENLVLALKELNERAALKGPRGIGADVTVNSVPAPLNLFMNIPWQQNGDIKFESPAGKKGDHVRLRAERDLVVVMSACPQDVLDINAKAPNDGHFIVEEEGAENDEDIREKLQAYDAKKKQPPASAGRRTSTASTSTAATRKPAPKLNGGAPKTGGLAAAKKNAASGAAKKPAASSPAASKPTSTPSSSTAQKTPSAPASSGAATPSSSSAAAKRTPLGQTKKPKAPSATQKRTPLGQTKAPKSAAKPATSTPAASSAKETTSPAVDKAGDKAESAAPAAQAPPAEKKKPRKLQRPTAA